MQDSLNLFNIASSFKWFPPYNSGKNAEGISDKASSFIHFSEVKKYYSKSKFKKLTEFNYNNKELVE